jgi:hypothetical protein
MIRDLMSGGTSVEDTLTLWASSLRDVKRRIWPLFTQERVARSAGQFLDGLLGNEPRQSATGGSGSTEPACRETAMPRSSNNTTPISMRGFSVRCQE